MTAKNRPNSRRSMTLPERHGAFLSVKEINDLIDMLQEAYRQTNNEVVYEVLMTLKNRKDATLSLEELFREDELNEFWENPGKFPHSVRTWFMLYRDKENEV